MLKSLLSVRLQSFFGSNFSIGKGGKRKASVAMGAVYLLLGAMFAFMSGSVAVLMAGPMIAMEMEWLYFTLFSLITFSLIFVFSVFETKSMLFECKDNDLLLSMPIPVRDIVLSRIFAVLVINYLETAVIMLPAIVVFAIEGGAVSGVFGSLITAVAIPLIATSLATCVGYLVALISKRFKDKTYVSMILYILFFVAYFAVYDWMMNGLSVLEDDPSGFISRVSRSLNIAKGLGEASMLEPIPVVVLLAVTALVSFGVLLLVSKNYVNIITKSVKTIRTEYVRREYRSNSAAAALSGKEFSRLLSSATYMMNGGISFILQIGLSVFLLVKRDSIAVIEPMLSQMLGVQTDGLTALMLSCVSVLMLSMCMVLSASALSLEGDSLWIIASAPVRAVDIIIAKIMPQLSISIVTSLISSFLLAISVGAGLLECVFIFAVPLIASFIFSFAGICLNIALPKFKFESEAQIVKQSGASAAAVFSAIGFSVLVIACGLVFSVILGVTAAFAIITAAMILIAALLGWVLFVPARHRLEDILAGR